MTTMLSRKIIKYLIIDIHEALVYGKKQMEEVSADCYTRVAAIWIKAYSIELLSFRAADLL